MTEEYLTRDVAKMLGKSAATVEYYTNRGIVSPDVEPRQGKGKARIYSERNLLEFGMVDVMTRMGLSLRTVELAMHVLRKGSWFSSELTKEWLAIVDKEGAEKAVQWHEQRTIRFEDFWTSDAWGVSKELAYVDMYGFDPSGEPLFGDRVEVVRKRATGFHLKEPFDQEAFVVTVVWCGAIKNAARRLIGR